MENIIVENKLISDFMELKYNPNNGQCIEGFMKGKYGSWFHSSWDWLMPVCQKIISDECRILIPHNGINESIGPYINNCHKMKTGTINFDIEKTWNGVVEFIKWYNENKTQVS
jgi:hypothetical protein